MYSKPSACFHQQPFSTSKRGHLAQERECTPYRNTRRECRQFTYLPAVPLSWQRSRRDLSFRQAVLVRQCGLFLLEKIELWKSHHPGQIFPWVYQVTTAPFTPGMNQAHLRRRQAPPCKVARIRSGSPSCGPWSPRSRVPPYQKLSTSPNHQQRDSKLIINEQVDTPHTAVCRHDNNNKLNVVSSFTAYCAVAYRFELLGGRT